MQIPSHVFARIVVNLAKVEVQHNVKVIYVCESGSRIWGIHSPDSDYDVRFLYYHPLSWYLKLTTTKKDTITVVDENIDMHGWDIRKALNLLLKSNSTIYDWLFSSIIYKEDDCVFQLRQIAKNCFSEKDSCYHYLGLARGEFFKTRSCTLKKYLYIFRGLMCVNWILTGLRIPPASINELFHEYKKRIPTDIKSEIENMLTMKRASQEQTSIPFSLSLNDFIREELNLLDHKVKEKFLQNKDQAKPNDENIDAADKFFMLLIST